MFPRQPTYIGFSGVIVIAFIWTSPVQAEENYVELWRHGRYTEALQAVEEASQSTTHFSLAQVRDQSELLFLTGRVDEAIEVRRAVTARQPLPSDLVRLAEYQRYRGRWEDGEQTLERVTEQVQLLLQYDSITEEEWLALGRLNELQGADAKLVLVHYRRLQEQQNSVEAHVAVGDLALATAAYDLAATEYSAALELDAQNQEALSGLLACFHESGDRRAEEVAAKLAAINPNHPRALIIAGRRHLDLGELEDAEEALALKAAVGLLRFDQAGYETIRLRVLEFNPGFAEFDRIVSEVAARHYRFDEAVALLRAAAEIDGQDPGIRFDLALNLLRLGQDEEARVHLQAAFQDDPYNVHAFNLLEVADEMDSFAAVGDSLWHLQLPALEAEVLSTAMLDLLNQASSRLEARYEVDLERPVIVQMFRDHDAFMVRSTGLPGNAGHLGICFGRLITMDSPRARPTGTVNWQQVLWHEFVHVVTLQKTRNRMPRWLSEGVSVYEETRRERRSNSHHLPRSALSRAYQTQRRRRGSYRFYRQQRIGHHMGAEAAGIPLYADLTSHRKYGLRRHGERPGGC